MSVDVLAHILDGDFSWAALMLWKSGDRLLRSKLINGGVKHMDLRMTKAQTQANWPRCLKDFKLVSLSVAHDKGFSSLDDVRTELQLLHTGIQRLELSFDQSLVALFSKGAAQSSVHKDVASALPSGPGPELNPELVRSMTIQQGDYVDGFFADQRALIGRRGGGLHFYPLGDGEYITKAQVYVTWNFVNSLVFSTNTGRIFGSLGSVMKWPGVPPTVTTYAPPQGYGLIGYTATSRIHPDSYYGVELVDSFAPLWGPAANPASAMPDPTSKAESHAATVVLSSKWILSSTHTSLSCLSVGAGPWSHELASLSRSLLQ